MFCLWGGNRSVSIESPTVSEHNFTVQAVRHGYEYSEIVIRDVSVLMYLFYMLNPF
jgi:hypothetical protein